MHRRTALSSVLSKLKWGVVPLSICLLLIVVPIALAACSSTASTVESAQDRTTGDTAVLPAPVAAAPSTGDTSPDFTGTDVMTGETISLSQFSGSTILLNFVNYGCSQSLNQIVSNQLLGIRNLTEQRDDFMPVSVFCGCCPEEVLRDFAEQNDLRWPWILDSDYSILRKYESYLGDYGYPTLVFIDKDQNIREVAGYTDVSELNAKLDALSSY